jgi:integrase
MEATAMTWGELEGDHWSIPAARYKTKRDHGVPLSRAAATLLKQMPRIGQFVFTTNGRTPIGGISIRKAELDKTCGVTGWTLHDLRRTARSLMSRAGVPADHAERALGHVISGVRGTYDRHEFHAEKKQAFEALATQIQLILHPKANVTMLRR